MIFQTIDLRILPPSSGKPGIRLNNARAKLIKAKTWTIDFTGHVMNVNILIDVNKPNNTMLTKGPAIATQNDSAGVLDSLSKLAKPPKINRVIDFTSIPWYRATKLCPNSWAKTEENNNNAVISPNIQGRI